MLFIGALVPNQVEELVGDALVLLHTEHRLYIFLCVECRAVAILGNPGVSSLDDGELDVLLEVGLAIHLIQ